MGKPAAAFGFVVAVAVCSLWVFSPVAHEIERLGVATAAPLQTAQEPPPVAMTATPPASDALTGAGSRGEQLAAPAVHDSGSIHFITVQTGASPTWCRMLLSAQLSGVTVHNLAWGHKYAHSKRPRWILDWIAERRQKHGLRSGDVLMFGDGGDTLFSGVPLHEVQARFVAVTESSEEEWNATATAEGRQFSTANAQALGSCVAPARGGSPSAPLPAKCRHAPVIFNAEANCYHQQAFKGSWGPKKGRCLAAYKRRDPKVTSRYRYLNAGAWIGRVWAVEKVFSVAKRIIDSDSSIWCDQSVMGAMYLTDATGGAMGLDTMNRYFLPTYHLRVNSDFCGEAESVAERLPRMRMCHSGNTPALVHFNGKSEGTFTADVIRRARWHSDGAREQAALLATARDGVTELHGSHGTSRQLIGEVCPRLSFPS